MSRSKKWQAVSAAALICVLSSSVEAQTAHEKAAAVVSQMTTAEKLQMVKGYFPAFEKNPAPDAIISAGYVPGIPRLGLPALKESDAGMGVANLLNKRTDDVATSLPSGLAVGATWDPELAFAGGAMIGSEARAKGFNVLLAGGANLVRDPRNGRNFEYPGEDPLLVGVIAGNAIKGVQSNNILSTIKHYAINDQETGRNVLNATIDEASARESDLLAFELAIEIGQPASVMCGYNKINGDYACENDFLLNRVLKTDWGYKGWVMSDWGSVHSSAKAANSGLDHQSAFKLDKKPWFDAPLQEALASGEVTPARLDDMALRVVESFFETGLIERPVPTSPETIDYAANAQISQRAAEGGIVLLRNANNLLPLDLAGKKVAIIGGHADIGVLSGGGSSQVRPVGGPALELTPPGPVGAFARITYFPSSPLKELQARFPTASISFVSGESVPEAVTLAKASDIVIFFADQWTAESEDVPTMNLPRNQDELISAISGANKHVVVVLETGGPVALPWNQKVSGIVAAWYPGSNGGRAITRVLAGDVDASGRLPVSFLQSVEQTPRVAIPGLVEKKNSKGVITYGLDYSLKSFDVDYNIEGSDVGYRWLERQKQKPLYAFGHGLSYTRFAYSGLSTDGLNVRFKVRNAGKRAGIDTPQIYVDVKGRDGRTIRRLAGWQKVPLKAGESRTIELTIDPRVIANYDVSSQQWDLNGGNYKIYLSTSSDKPVVVGSTTLPALRIKP